MVGKKLDARAHLCKCAHIHIVDIAIPVGDLFHFTSKITECDLVVKPDI